MFIQSHKKQNSSKSTKAGVIGIKGLLQAGLGQPVLLERVGVFAVALGSVHSEVRAPSLTKLIVDGQAQRVVEALNGVDGAGHSCLIERT